jgi:hypothetical protein
MNRSWNRTHQDRLARAAFYLGDPRSHAALPRELRIAAIIDAAPRFPMEDVAEDLILKMQGGLRGHVRDVELN